jgi:co-chaperonin GroES (HSP10)
MKLSKQEFESLRPFANHVVVKPDRLNDECIIGNDIKLYLDATWADGEHVCVTGEIVKVPAELTMMKHGIPLMDWVTDMQLCVGDKVWYDFVAAKNCFEQERNKDTRFIDVDGEIYIVLKYQDFFLTKRGEETIMLNGYILAEPVDEELKTTIELPEHLKKKDSAKYAKVVTIGKGNTRYLDERIPPDSNEIGVGDFITFVPYANIELEYDLHATFEGKKKFYRIHRRFITAVVNETITKN